MWSSVVLLERHGSAPGQETADTFQSGFSPGIGAFLHICFGGFHQGLNGTDVLADALLSIENYHPLAQRLTFVILSAWLA
jgi:hypothetical protein